MIYAHSVPGEPEENWEPLSCHLDEVATLAARFAAAFTYADLAKVAGLLHDIGKCSSAFQAYIHMPSTGGSVKGPDHSGAGAIEAAKLYTGSLGRMLSFVVAGHHAGLPDFDKLDQRLQRTVPAYPGWQEQTGPLDTGLAPSGPWSKSCHRGFMQAFLIRMLFSCLVDADSLATEAFYARTQGNTARQTDFTPLAVLQVRLRSAMAMKQANANVSSLNTLRADILAHVVNKAEMAPGLFTLTVPTGGGKTLASLSFALDHAIRHDQRRIIYVIPFTSIIEQTADVFRTVLDTSNDILEHHASYDWEAAATVADADSEGQDGLAKLRRASENWDAPIIVTTAVQFFESLFANRRSRCRKLHNLARSVIILDEAQTLPLHLLRPCLAALDELARNYGASIVLCTATQPAIRKQDRFADGLDIPHTRELAPDPTALYAQLKRVVVSQAGEVTDEALADRFAIAPRMLCIVSTRAHASALFERIRGLQGAVYLTTLMVPRHRRMVLEQIRADLKAERPVRLVATSLIEAGVDVDFPEVWRAVAGLDSIAQAAGRCNREGGPVPGRVVVFKPAGRTPPRAMRVFADIAAETMSRHEDPLTLDAMEDYFRHLYWNRGQDKFDAAKLDGEAFPILARIGERAHGLDFPFEKIARAFRLIDEAMASVVVPWRANPDDRHAARLLERIAAMERPLQADLRGLQQYSVPIPRAARDEWLARGALRAVHPRLGPDLLTFTDDALYNSLTGLGLDDPTYRRAEENIA